MKTLSESFSNYLSAHCDRNAINARYDGNPEPFLRAFARSAESKECLSGATVGSIMAETRKLSAQADGLIRAFCN